MKYLIPCVITMLLLLKLSAQNKLEGLIKSDEGELLPYINVLIHKPGSKLLVAYAVSKENGYFEAIVNNPSDSLDIEISSVNYKNEIRRVANTPQKLDFILVPEIMQLEGITVKAPAIEQRGDTIVYLVNSFAKQEDRSIEDVLRRMPGIEIEPGGRILYQGLPLQRFYVEGLDLMNGRYVVVSKNLPLASVSSVEILENHQPLRILEERVASNQASINIKLRHNVTATGTAKLGAGLSPFLWEANITPMIFMKNFQLLVSYQTNNNGDDVSEQLRINTFQDLIHMSDRPSDKPEIVNLRPVNPPEIDEDRYLDNNIHLLNMNGLLRLNKDFQLRTNLFYINDFQQQKVGIERKNYTPTDTITYTEDYNNRLYDNYLHGEFTLSRNVKENYLNNELKFQSRWDKQRSDILNGSRDISQELDNPFSSFSNDLRSINPIGNYLVEFNSYISYDQSPHELSIIPGQFENMLNEGESYDEAIQHIVLDRFYTDQSASFVFGWKGLSFTPRIGIAYRQQLLESKIFLLKDDSSEDAGADFANSLDGRHTRLYGQTNIEYRWSKITVKAKLPLSWQIIKMEDKIINSGQNFNGVLFDPSVSVNYKVNGFWRLRGAWSFANRLGDMDRIHYGYILSNYRILSKNGAPISHTQRNNYSVYISFRNPIITFFNSLTYIYSISNNNLLYSSLIQSDGTSLLQTYNIPNKTYTHSFQGQSSKFISKIKTTISFRASLNLRKGESLLNAQLFDTKTLFYTLVPELNFKITKWLNAEYGLNANFIKTYIEDDEKSDISLLKHHLSIFAYPFNNQLVSLSTEYYNHENADNLFVDFLYRYSLKKQKIDLEFRWNNIFNNETYTSYFASSYTVTESIYYLRPSQVLFSIKFSY